MNNKNYTIMKKLIYETLNEQMFIELFEENGMYYISVLFRFTHKSHLIKYKTYEGANDMYNTLIK